MREVRAVLVGLVAGVVILPTPPAQAHAAHVHDLGLVHAAQARGTSVRGLGLVHAAQVHNSAVRGLGLVDAAQARNAPVHRLGPGRAGYGPRVVDAGQDCPARAVCGRMRVPLDRQHPGAGTTSVAFRLVYRRDRSRPAEGTLLPNPGGPGLAVIGHRDYAGKYRDLLATYDLLLVDPRGVGESDPLTCRSARGADLHASRARAVAAAAACAREIGPRRAYYTTAAVADDIDDVRARLGIDRLDLLGQSYGTQLMTVYAARHPRHVSSVVLSSAYPTRFDMLGRPAARAMRRAVRLLCDRSGGVCDGRDVLDDLAVVAERLDERPLRYGSRRAVLDETALAGTVYKLASGHAELFGRLPAALREAVHGDAGPLVALAEQVRPISGFSGGGVFSVPMFLTVSCNDNPVLWDRRASLVVRARQYEAALARVDRRDFRPFRPAAWIDGIADLGDLCIGWPGVRARPLPRLDRLPNVPVLVLSGELDTGTPTEEGVLAARPYRHARLLEVPSAGHVAEQDDRAAACVISLETRFIRRGRVSGQECLRRIPPVPVRSPSHSLL
ncbi:alpha/beta hydrolase [Sphaerisporangium sp. NPDC051011]|uniref:alpha/beta hydrolase n=1 Tax=Sphaerisporangium sp. NPDC051011 TaxID=3155792 RepID=UPI0033C186EB